MCLPRETSFQLNGILLLPRRMKMCLVSANSIGPPALLMASRTVVGTTNGYSPALATAPSMIVLFASHLLNRYGHKRLDDELGEGFSNTICNLYRGQPSGVQITH